jgi:AcrR family transcriptional regulator
MTQVRSRSNRIPPEERYAEILRCATDLFAEKGFIPTTMDDVAERANITKRTLYRYVKSKDDLLFAIHDTFSGYAWVSETAHQHEEPDAALRRAYDQHVRTVCGHLTEIGVFFDERKHLSHDNAAMVETRRHAWQGHVESILVDGVRTGAFVDLPVRPMAQLTLGAMTELYRWYRPDGPLTPVELANDYERLFMEGVSSSRDRSLPASPQLPRSAPPTNDVPGSDNRDRVLDAAVSAFARHGYHATSIQDLAEEAQVSKGAVMYHAGLKNALLADVHIRTFKNGISTLKRALAEVPEDAGSFETLHGMLAAHFAFLAEDRDAIIVINDNLRYLKGKDLRKVLRLREKWANLFAQVVKDGYQNDEFTGVDQRFFVRVLIGMLNSAARWYQPGGRLSTDELADIAFRVLMFGIANHVGRDQSTSNG